ncbi:MAG: phosphatidylglycerophosphatase A [Gemmatimonadota bacterium]|nr:phosphatidylglycerophosphatase A [Gemmatimonadota bacterium]
MATLFFVGYAPWAPGTAGTAFVALLYWLFFPPLGMLEWLGVLLVASAIGVYSAGRAAPEWGEDPGQVVIDEGVGFLFAVAFLPASAGTVIAGFFVFRVFDIVKPPPARQLEALPRGWGIVADDVIAGLYSNVVIRLVEWAS